MKRQLVRSLLVGAVAVLLAAFATPAYAQFGGLTGRVVDGAGKPIADAEIVLDFVGDVVKQITTKTDEKGQWVQAGLMVGKWNVKISKGGATAKLIGQVVTLGAMFRIKQDMVLKGVVSDVPADLAKGKSKDGKDAKPSAEDAAYAKLNAEMQATFKEGVTALNTGSVDEAIAKFESLLVKNEKCATCRTRLGDALLKKGDQAGAEAAYMKAIETDGTLPDPYASLANLYNLQQKFDEATKASAKAMELMDAAPGGADPAVVYNQGIIFWNQSKIAEAGAQFAKAVKLDPKMADAHYWLAMTLVNQGKLTEAKPEFQEYVKLAPTGQYVDTAKAIIATIK